MYSPRKKSSISAQEYNPHIVISRQNGVWSVTEYPYEEEARAVYEKIEAEGKADIVILAKRVRKHAIG